MTCEVAYEPTNVRFYIQFVGISNATPHKIIFCRYVSFQHTQNINFCGHVRCPHPHNIDFRSMSAPNTPTTLTFVGLWEQAYNVFTYGLVGYPQAYNIFTCGLPTSLHALPTSPQKFSQPSQILRSACQHALSPYVLLAYSPHANNIINCPQVHISFFLWACRSLKRPNSKIIVGLEEHHRCRHSKVCDARYHTLKDNSKFLIYILKHNPKCILAR